MATARPSGITTLALLLKRLSGKQWRQEKLSFFLRGETWSDDSLSFPKDPQNHGGTFFSRILDFQAICSLDSRAAAMRKPAWMSIDDAHLASSSASVHASLGSHTSGSASGCQPRLLVARTAGQCPRFVGEKRQYEERMLLTKVWVATELSLISPIAMEDTANSAPCQN